VVRFSNFVFWMVLLAFIFEAIVMPVSIVFDIGFSLGYDSGFFARFGYVFIFIVGVFVLFVFCHRNWLWFWSFALILVGLSIGFYEGYESGKWVAHVFYVLMPPVVFSLGYYFAKLVSVNVYYQTVFLAAVRFSALVVAIVVAVFSLASKAGLSSYNAIGLSAFLFAAPFLYTKNAWFFVAFCILAFLAGKSTVFGALVASGFIFYAIRGSALFRCIVLFGSLIFLLLIYVSDLEFVNNHRTVNALSSLLQGDFESFSSGRWSEAQAMLQAFKSPFDWVFGLGYGATFVPWSDSPDYLSHYVHFGNLTWLYINGLLGYTVFLCFLLYVLSVNIKIISNSGDMVAVAVSVVVISLLILSAFGAVLMTSSLIWLFIGWSIANYHYDIKWNTR